ncbi:hypothetical protein BVRB_5g105340 [Beta vulgaris subsp. vulgaris]|nr:hypothetical protein BVRB_5g105340 [Beta vulgaris subsp. vulgaris]
MLSLVFKRHASLCVSIINNLEAEKGPEFNYAFSLGQKYQDAEVGALAHMLRTTPPVRQDSS